MITKSAAAWQSESWQKVMAQAVRSPEALFNLLELSREQLPAANAADRDFSLRAPLGYVKRMEKGNPDDPLLRQILPLGDELHTEAGFSADPVGDLNAIAIPGLLHKYPGRVLLMTTGVCAVHCRYCFRRHYPYSENPTSPTQWQPALDYIAAHTDVHEVILSGGDPLSLSDDRLEWLVSRIAAIAHIERLRIHTRTPVVLPERVDSRLLRWLQACTLQTVMVIHCNHPNELDSNVTAALKRLSKCSVTLLNQSVLLRDVNDHADTLAQLSEALFKAGVLPYYLHQLDKVSGAHHFEVANTDARTLIHTLRTRLPGYLVPKLVIEQPGELAKTPLD